MKPTIETPEYKALRQMYLPWFVTSDGGLESVVVWACGPGEAIDAGASHLGVDFDCVSAAALVQAREDRPKLVGRWEAAGSPTVEDVSK